MTVASDTPLSRRTLLAGGVAAVALGAAALVAWQAPALLSPRYAPTPFDDLLSRLPDRDNARRLGAAVLAGQKSFDARATAARLRTRIGDSSLGDTVTADLNQGRLAEIHGWVLPETLTSLCALAAKAG
jgi:hypothetical protein